MEMKIAYIVTKYPSITETFLKREINTLNKLGLDITIFAAARSNNRKADNNKNTVIYRPALISKDSFLATKYTFRKFPSAPFKILLLFLKSLLSFSSDAKTLLGNLHTICYYIYFIDKYRLSHIHAYFFNWPACIGLAITKITNKPFSIAAHARDIFVEATQVKEKTKNAKFIVACSKQAVNHLKKILPQKLHKKIHLNYHGINLNSTILPDTSQKPKNNILIAVGRLIPKKGFPNLLHAFAIVLKRFPQTILLIVGDGPQQNNLSEMCKDLKLKQNALLLGWQNNKTTIKLINDSNILLVPSIIDSQGDRDGIPNVILEAIATKTPVIASRLPSIKEIIKNNSTGLLCNPNDCCNLAESIKYLLVNLNLRRKLAQNAYEKLKKDFDCEKNCKKLIKLFKKS